jgi:cytochrome c oxidase assembly factor CtaG
VEAPLEVTALVPFVLVAYLFAVRHERPSRARLAALVLGLALIVAAFATRLEPLALHDFLWAHLLQNVVLAEWAPALLVLAVPPALAARVHVRPLVALPLWLANYYVWHLPWLYDLALRHPHTLLHLEHLSYLVTGMLVWWPVVHGSLPAGARAAYLFCAFVLASPLGLLLALIPTPVYAVYKASAPTWGVSALTDQEIAGVTMAGEQALVFFVVFTVFFLRFLSEEQRAGALDELRSRSA